MGKLLNDWIETRISAEGLSITGLAKRMGISHSYLSNVLSGNKEPGSKFYLGVAKAFNLSVEAVERMDKLGQAPDEMSDEELIEELLTLARRLARPERRQLVDFAIFLASRLQDDP
ncbi:MAG: helix-turn-helix transcriptional regulator [Anaerolineales bacterium]|nr:helix-turn-helix transcriptional regulator [Anaerolineales bacterium]